jgi:hypothetical protein
VQSDIRASAAEALRARFAFKGARAGALLSLLPIAFAHCFPLLLHCFHRPGVSLDISIPSIADGIADPLQIDCRRRTKNSAMSADPRSSPQLGRAAAESTAPTGTSVGLGSFCARD